MFIRIASVAAMQELEVKNAENRHNQSVDSDFRRIEGEQISNERAQNDASWMLAARFNRIATCSMIRLGPRNG